MATLNFGIRVRHNYEEKEASIRAIPPQLTDAWQDSTEDNLRVLERETYSAIASIAGGVYWDVNSSYARESNGARARVWTPKSKPHRIVPKQRNGVLHFFINGREVFTRWVNHPGSRPVQWVGRVANTAPALMRENYSKGARGVLERLA